MSVLYPMWLAICNMLSCHLLPYHGNSLSNYQARQNYLYQTCLGNYHSYTHILATVSRTALRWLLAQHVCQTFIIPIIYHYLLYIFVMNRTNTNMSPLRNESTALIMHSCVQSLSINCSSNIAQGKDKYEQKKWRLALRKMYSLFIN